MKPWEIDSLTLSDLNEIAARYEGRGADFRPASEGGDAWALVKKHGITVLGGLDEWGASVTAPSGYIAHFGASPEVAVTRCVIELHQQRERYGL